MREGLAIFATERTEAGQAVYSPMVLRTYDWIVLGLSNRFLWRCPTAELLGLYDRNVTERHLDIGVGTGYFLDKAKWPVAKPVITLLDLNLNCLTTASRRIRGLRRKLSGRMSSHHSASWALPVRRALLPAALSSRHDGGEGHCLRSP